MRHRYASLIGIVALLLLAPSVASAHALLAQAKLERGKVLVEAKFEGDEPAEKAKVYLIGSDGEKVLRGRTDSEGHLRFDAPSPGKYEILVDAGAGHQARVTITITEEMLRAPATAEPVLISEGPSIEEATSGTWWKVGVGLAAIVAFAAILMIVARRQRSTPATS
jgi:hypothetical protein